MTILVIKHNDEKYDKDLKKNWEQYYKGKYLIIDEYSIDNYTDKVKYRYVFTRRFYNSTGQSSGGPSFTFTLFDRLDDKEYTSSIDSPFWSKLMIAYINKLNSI